MATHTFHSASRGAGLLCCVLSVAIAGCGGGTRATVGPSRGGTPSLAASATASATVGATPSASSVAAPTPSQSDKPTPANYADLPGWIVFEHFGQAPDGSTHELNFDNRMIWLVRADGSGLHELAPGVPASGKASPDVSPDGRSVVFNTWAEYNQIWTVPITGGAPTLISTDCGASDRCSEGAPTFSSDGKRLAFVRQETVGSETTTRIGIRDLASGSVELLDGTSVPAGEGYLDQPTWSPDGTHIAYYRSTTEHPGDEHITDAAIYIASADDARVDGPFTTPGGRWAADPDWSPDGSKIIFSTSPERETEGWGDFPGTFGIWTMSPDGTDVTRVCSPCLTGGSAPTWTADGRIMFWGNRTWALMNADGTEMRPVNETKLTWFGDALGFGYAAVLATQ